MGWMDVIRRLQDAVGLTDRQVVALERRRLLRVPKRVAIVGIRKTDEQVHMVALDAGPNGLRVELGKRLQKGETLMLYSARQARQSFRNVGFGSDAAAVYGKIVWVKGHKDKIGHSAGIAFVLESGEDRAAVARFLLDDCDVGLVEGREHRMAPRVTSELSGFLKMPWNESIEGTVRDIAVGGALFIVSQPIPRHTIAEVHVDLPGMTTPLVCRGLVVRCIPRGTDVCELGIAFTVVAPDHKERLITTLARMLGAST